MDIKELLPKDTEGRLRIIQETVPGSSTEKESFCKSSH